MPNLSPEQRLAEIKSAIAYVMNSTFDRKCADCIQAVLHELMRYVDWANQDAPAAPAKDAQIATLQAENLRLFDLVRHQRHELHKAELITNEEYASLMTDPRADGPGSPSPRRIESYDQMRSKLATLGKTCRGMREALSYMVQKSEWVSELPGTQWADDQDLSQEVHWLNEARKEGVAALAVAETEAEQRARENAEKAAEYDKLLEQYGDPEGNIATLTDLVNTYRNDCEHAWGLSGKSFQKAQRYDYLKQYAAIEARGNDLPPLSCLSATADEVIDALRAAAKEATNG